MATVFRYAGYNSAGQKIKGVVVADSKTEAHAILEKRGVYVASMRSIPAWLTQALPISGKNIAIFFSGLARLIRSGVDISTAVDILAREQFNPKIALVLYQIRDSLAEGLTISSAFAKAEIFSEDVVAMIRVGEESGRIADVFDNLAQLYEERDRIKSSMFKSLAYPALLLTGATGALLYIVPKTVLPIEKLLKNFSKLKGGEMDLPAITKGTIAVVHFVSSYGLYILLGTIAFITVFLFLYKRNRSFKVRIDNVLIRLPLVGGLLSRLFVYKTLLSVALLYNAGVEMSRAFRMIEKLQSIEVFKNDISLMKRKIEEGVDFPTAISYSKLFPESYKTLMKIGARSGSLSQTLDDLVRYARETFMAYSEFVTKITGPVALLLVAGVVGLVLVAVYSPIFNMMDILKSR